MITRLAVALSASLFAAAPVFAQVAPGTIERTIPKFEPKPVEQRPRTETPRVAAPAGATIAGTFVLGAVNIEGATVFSSAELAESFEPFLASRVGQAELDKITASITDRYRRAGYLLSYAILPEQSVQSGIIRIRVVEGFIDKVRIEGDRTSAAAVSPIAKRLSADRPLRTQTLERALGLMRDLPGILVRDVRITRSPGDPSRHQLTIVLSGDRTRLLSYADNRGTIAGARLRGYSSISFAPLAIPGDQVQLDLFAIPSDKFRFLYGQAKASVPLGSDGLRLSAAVSRADQLQRLDGPNQHGKSRQISAELAYPFTKSRAWSIGGHASISDWSSEEERAGAVVQRDRLQVARAWLEFRRAAKTRIDGRVSISQGLDLDSATNRGDPLASRPGASAGFTKFDLSVRVASAVSDHVVLRAEAAAQYATRPLLAPEEFSLGGSRIGRAYDFNEVTGDHGIGGMIELSYRLGDVSSTLKGVELFGFADGGGAFRKQPTAAFPDDQWLADVGAGTRFSVLGMLWSGEVGVPIARSGPDRGIRAFFSVAKLF